MVQSRVEYNARIVLLQSKVLVLYISVGDRLVETHLIASLALIADHSGLLVRHLLPTHCDYRLQGLTDSLR